MAWRFGWRELVGAGVILAGLIAAIVTLRAVHDTLILQVTDRFTEAVVQLGHENTGVRLGGVYALERIARVSPSDQAKAVQVLTAFIRDRTPVTEGTDGTGSGDAAPLPVELQAALTVIGRRTLHYQDGETERLDLRHTDLRRADLTGAHLEGAILTGARLADANLEAVWLQGAILRGADLRRANLIRSDLSRAFLGQADLSGAKLGRAVLDETYLIGARLDGADLRGADLSRTVGLSWEQVQLARRDGGTAFPTAMMRAESPMEDGDESRQ